MNSSLVLLSLATFSSLSTRHFLASLRRPLYGILGESRYENGYRQTPEADHLYHHRHHPRRDRGIQAGRGGEDLLARRPVHDGDHHYHGRLPGRHRGRQHHGGKGFYHHLSLSQRGHDLLPVHGPRVVHGRGRGAQGLPEEKHGEAHREDEGPLHRLRHRHGGPLHRP